ncbi:MAG TPA: anti-sigma factor [bacterium]|nr:anti-sigma factor [bacterium]
MKLERPEIREVLAGEYALGLLAERTRRGFERRLKTDAGLRGSLRNWERRFNSVVETLEPVEPPAQLWIRVYENLPKKRLVQGEGKTLSLWESLNFWRNLAFLGSALAVLLLTYVGFGPGFRRPLPAQVAMISDPKSDKTAWMVSVMPDRKMLKVTAMDLPAMPADRDCELWMLPAGGQAPVSLGLLPMQGTMTMPVAAGKMKILAQATGLAVSLEPKGGSPTGAPTGPVLYQASIYPL